MDAQSIRTIHELLWEVRLYLERHDDLPPEAFAVYDSQPVRPKHAHRRKEDHKRAINLLIWCLSRSTDLPAMDGPFKVAPEPLAAR